MINWYVLIAFGCGFLVAQLWKMVSGLLRGKKEHEITDFKSAIGYFSRSGGMPSGHSASMMAATMYVGLVSGFRGGAFAMMACVTAIVIYDAVHVRYAVGEQGKALNKLLKKAGEKELPVVEGHTVAQALVGIVLGVVIALVIFALTPRELYLA